MHFIAQLLKPSRFTSYGYIYSMSGHFVSAYNLLSSARVCIYKTAARAVYITYLIISQTILTWDEIFKIQIKSKQLQKVNFWISHPGIAPKVSDLTYQR
jgi:hypothetical protein